MAKIYTNGKYVEAPIPTNEEITAMQEAQARFEAEQAKLPPTESERLEALEAAFMEFVEVMMGG